MFNALGDDPKTSFVRSLLLLDVVQKEWTGKAKTSDHRLVRSMPITLKQLRAALASLVEPTAPA